MFIVRPWLLIGSYRDSIRRALLDDHQIGALLHLAESVEHDGIACRYIPVVDGLPLPADQLRQGVAFIREQQAAQQRVLVACGAGISRSVTFAMAALKEAENLSLLQAYQAVLAVHPDALPHPALWEALRVHYGETMTFAEMWNQR